MRCLKILLTMSPASKRGMTKEGEVGYAAEAVEVAAAVGLGGVGELFGAWSSRGCR